MATVETGLRIAKLALLVNALLAIGKIATGILGNSYVLVADGIESTADIFSSVIVWGGLRVGWLRAPRSIVLRLGRVKGALNMGTGAFEQLAALELLADYPAIAERRRAEAAERMRTLVDALASGAVDAALLIEAVHGVTTGTDPPGRCSAGAAWRRSSSRPW